MSDPTFTQTSATGQACFSASQGRCGRGHWSGANIAAIIAGFLIFAPLGFVALLWTLLGRPIQDLPGWLREQWRRGMGLLQTSEGPRSDNVVFNEYQQSEYDRIDEIRDEIGRRARAFQAFRAEASRRRDEAEFNAFMSGKPGETTRD